MSVWIVKWNIYRFNVKNIRILIISMFQSNKTSNKTNACDPLVEQFIYYRIKNDKEKATEFFNK